jgi:predicted phage-related endonuclease
MIVRAYPVADVAALIGGNDFRIYTVPADAELQNLILDREAAFWEMVKAGTPPDPTTFADLKQRFGAVSKAQTVQASPEAMDAIARLKEIKALSAEEDKLKAVIMAALKEADTLIDGQKVLATWKAQKGAKHFDSKAFQDIEPGLYKQYLKEGDPVRRLLIK